MPRLIITWLAVGILGAAVWFAWPRGTDTGEGGLYDQGLALLRKEQFGEAAEKFEKWVARDPGNAVAHRYLGESLLGAGRRSEAVQALERARELDSELTDAAKFLGRSAMEEGDDARAVELFEEVLRKRTDQRVQADLGVLYLRGGRVREGIDAFEAALRYELKPPPIDEALAVAELIRHRGRILDFSDEESRAGRMFQKVLGWIQSAGEDQSADSRFGPQLARAYLGMGRIKEARHWASLSMREADPTTVADMRLVLARLASNLGMENEVEEHVVAAREAEQTAERFSDIASFWEETGRTDRVLQTLETGKYYLRDDLAMLVLWADGYARAGRSGEALAGLQEQAGAFEDQPSYHLSLARVLLYSGSLEAAADVLSGARERFPENLDVHSAYLKAQLDLAAMQRLAGPEVDSLVREARAFAGRASTDPDLRSIEARALLSAGEADLAMEILRSVHRSDRGRLDWALDLGRGHFLSGKFEEAAKALTEALSRTAADLPHYRRMHVESLYRSGLLLRAERAGRALVSRNARDLSARWLTTRVLLTLREFRSAEIEFAKLILLNPGDPHLILGKAYAHLAARTKDDVSDACLDARENARTPGKLLEVVAAEAELRRQAGEIGSAEGIRADQVPSILDVADFFYSLGLRDEALSLYRRHLSRSPGEIGPLRRICEYYFDEWRDFTEVDDRIANLTNRRPDLMDLRYLRGRRDCLGGDRADGIRSLASYLEVRGDDWSAHLALGEALVRERRESEALEHLLRARELRPYHEGIRQSLGELVMSEAARLHAEGTVEELRGLSRKVLGYVHVGFGEEMPVTRLLLSLGQAAGSLEVRKAMTPEDGGRAESHRLIGALLLERGDAKGARVSFAKALELSGGKSLDHHLLAVAALACADAESALGSAQAALAASKSHVCALEVSATALVRLGRLGDARRLVREAHDSSSEPAASNLVLARVLTACGEYDTAREALERSLEADPGYLWSMAALVGIVRAQSGGADALQLVSSSIEEAAGDLDLAVLAGGLLLEFGEESLAAVYLQRALDNSPENRDAALLLAEVCRRSGDRERELSALDAAILRDPRDADALLLLGHGRVRAGRKQLGVRSYRSCLLARPDSPEGRRSLVDLLRETGDGRAEAERVAEAGLRRDSGDPRLLMMLGSLLRESGRMKPARDLFARAVAGYQRMAPETVEADRMVLGAAVHRRKYTAAEIRDGLVRAEKALADAREQE